MKNLVTIVALSVDTRYATLYLQDGSTLNIEQGDARLPRIVEQSKKELEAGLAVTVDVTPIFVQRTEFGDAEKGTKGVVKFFRVAKSFLKGLVNTESPEKVDEAVAHISPLQIGVFPGQPESKFEVVDSGMGIHHVPKEATNQGTKEEDGPADPTPAVADLSQAEADAAVKARLDEAAEENATTGQAARPLTNDQKLDAARARMQQLVGNSVGTDRAEFHTPLNEETETIVAVHEKSGAIIPDAHKLARQLRSAQKLQDYAGFEKFIERLAGIIDQRGHSVEDLMKFIEKGDLPIADDGSIVIYKRLSNQGDHFVDVHSRNIKQKVGSYVFMKPGLVDPNRRQDCSNGLHVASLSYLNGFSGEITVIAKVRPEDVFAVPEYSHNKMRVCGYHILANLPDKLRHLVNGGGSISSDPDGAVLLNNVLRGNHIGVTQLVEVGGHRGSNVTYMDAGPNARSAAPAPISGAAAALAMARGTAETLDMQEPLEPKAPEAPDVKAADLVAKPDKELSAPVINNLMSNSTEKKADSAQSTTKPTLAQQAADLYASMLDAQTFPAERKAAKALRDLKQKARKGWTALGLPADTGDEIAKFLGEAAQPVPARVDRKKAPNKVSWPKVEKSAAVKDTLGDRQKTAIDLLKVGGVSNIEIARKTGLSKDQIFRLKKKHCA
jgi:hypothetical protein